MHIVFFPPYHPTGSFVFINCDACGLSCLFFTLRMTTALTGCRNVSHCQQQSYSGLRSPRRSYSPYLRSTLLPTYWWQGSAPWAALYPTVCRIALLGNRSGLLTPRWYNSPSDLFFFHKGTPLLVHPMLHSNVGLPLKTPSLQGVLLGTLLP